MQVPLSFALIVISFYVLIYILLSKREDKNKKFIVRVGNDTRRQDFIISEKDKSIFNQNSNPMLIVDSTYNITASNVSFNSFIGKNAKDLNLSLCLRSNELNDALSVALNNDKKSDISFMIYDQVHKYIQAQIFPIKIKKQNYALVMMIDETSQRVAEKVKSDFVSNVSHELKTPLTAITGFIETINGPAKNDEKQKEKFLKIIQNEAERMQRLVNDTLSLTRVEESEYQTPNEEVDLWICANSALDSVNHLAEKKQIKINLEDEIIEKRSNVKGLKDTSSDNLKYNHNPIYTYQILRKFKMLDDDFPFYYLVHSVALESLEGTDNTIKRAGRLSKEGMSVFKFCKSTSNIVLIGENM